MGSTLASEPQAISAIKHIVIEPCGAGQDLYRICDAGPAAPHPPRSPPCAGGVAPPPLSDTLKKLPNRPGARRRRRRRRRGLAKCVGSDLKVVLIRAPFDVCRGAGPCRRRSPLQAKLGPLESAACEVTRLPPVHEAQLQSERHGIEVCNLRERDSDTIALVRTERSVCHRRSPSAVRPWRLCAEGGGIECAETAIKKARARRQGRPAAGGSRQQVRPGRQRPGRARTGP